MTRSIQETPPGWRLFRLLLGAFSVSCLLALVTQLPERHIRETLDAVIQGTLLASIEPLDEACPDDDAAVPCVIEVSIGQTDHDELFGRSSPLDPDVLARFVEAVEQAAGQGQGQGPAMLAFDLDLAPVSTGDALRRERLTQALLRLSARTPVLLVCPQNYYHGSPTPEEALFIDTLIERSAASGAAGGTESSGGIRFAGAVIDSNGLYYDLKRAPLGAVAARWWNDRNHRSTPSLPDRHPCNDEAVAQEAQRSDPAMIVPSPIETVSFGSALEHADLLTGKIAVVGGSYGTEDVYRFRGVAQPYFGVTLHTWIAKDELRQKRQPGSLFRAGLDIAAGLLSGLVFSLLWTRAHQQGSSYGPRTLYYAGFLLAVLAFPTLILYLSIQSLAYGVTMGTAGMVISAMFDTLQGDAEATTPSSLPPRPVLLTTAVVVALSLGIYYLVDGLVMELLAALWTALAAWLLCRVNHRHPAQKQEEPSTQAAILRSWRDCARADLDAAGVRASSPLDKCIAGTVQGVMLAAVVVFSTDQLSAQTRDWDLLPVMFIGLFGLVCWVFDRVSTRHPTPADDQARA